MLVKLFYHRLVVVLSSYDAIQEAFLKKARDFSDRPYSHYFGAEIINKEDKGTASKEILILKIKLIIIYYYTTHKCRTILINASRFHASLRDGG